MWLGEMVEVKAVRPWVDVIRADDCTYYYGTDADCRISTLSPLHLEKAVEFYEIVLGPGGALASAAHFAGARELLTVRDGAVQSLLRTASKSSMRLSAQGAWEVRAGVSTIQQREVPSAGQRPSGTGQASPQWAALRWRHRQ